MGTMELNAVYMKVPEGYIAFVEEVPGANTQGDTLEEARENLREAVELVLEASRELAEKSLMGQSVTREVFVLDREKGRAMDRLTVYRQIIRQVLAEYARYKPANGEIETELVVDAERDHFELLHIG